MRGTENPSARGKKTRVSEIKSLLASSRIAQAIYNKHLQLNRAFNLLSLGPRVGVQMHPEKQRKMTGAARASFWVH